MDSRFFFLFGPFLFLSISHFSPPLPSTDRYSRDWIVLHCPLSTTKEGEKEDKDKENDKDKDKEKEKDNTGLIIEFYSCEEENELSIAVIGPSGAGTALFIELIEGVNALIHEWFFFFSFFHFILLYFIVFYCILLYFIVFLYH